MALGLTPVATTFAGAAGDPLGGVLPHVHMPAQAE